MRSSVHHPNLFETQLTLVSSSPIRGADRLQRVFETACDATPDALALLHDGECLTYAQLERRANQLAHELMSRGVETGDRVGIFLDRSIDTYITLLGILKSGAAFVPIDSSFPKDRVTFITKDASLKFLITDSAHAAALNGGLPREIILQVDTLDLDILPSSRPIAELPTDSLAYIIYTSGTTGRPKGVAVNHSSICNFLRVCSPIYGYRATDRVYQGMTIAFDFSIEEIWPTWMAGATIIVGPNDHRRLGSALAEFLIERQVSVMCCVPALLATIDRDIPALRLLLVGGEACPRDLVKRWAVHGRRMLNTYGPTETTVTATWTELHPESPVTIGLPLPTYTAYILDDQQQPVHDGEPGELCIGGPGVAVGYVNRPELTAEKFINDPFSKSSTHARLYRTGDLARRLPDGQIEYLGRIDSQIKIRGYRIELGEIESVLLEHPAVRQAVVTKQSLESGVEDLVAYLTLRDGSINQAALRRDLHESLHKRMPVYMVPAFIEILESLPTLASDKIDRSKLPAPISPRLSWEGGSYAPPKTSLERDIAEAFAAVLYREKVSVEADFFLELGGHSLFAAGVVSRLRKQPGFEALAISELYAHPTVRSLARHLELTTKPALPGLRQTERLYHSNRRVLGAGLTQFAMMYAAFLLFAIPTAIRFATNPDRSASGLLRTLLLWGPIAVPLPLALLPILAKWLLIGRFKPGRYPLWGWFYCRFWLWRKIESFSPMDVLAGSPLLAPYARLLGARVGQSCQLVSHPFEIPDLVEVGDDVSIGYGVRVLPYTVENGYLILDGIKIGSGSFIGANSVVMPGATIEAGARIGDQSLVSRDQVIPAGQTWAGSPAAHISGTLPLLHEMSQQSPGRRTWPAHLIAAFLLAFFLIEALPLLAIAPGLLMFEQAAARWGSAAALWISIPAGPVYVLAVCAIVGLGKRLFMRRARAGIFALRSFLGFRKWVADKLMDFSLASTNTLYATLYTLPWLRILGARIGPRSEVSTLSHIDPDVLSIGSESFVADDASVGAATYSNGLVALGSAEIGHRCFVGNSSLVPGNTKLGDNSLLGVQSVPPGPSMEPGSSWLGSPAIFLPRRDVNQSFDEAVTYRPSRRLVVLRYAIEFFRVTVPAMVLHLMLFVDLLATTWLADEVSGVTLALLLPLLYIASALAAIAFVIVLKWTIVGRYKPRVEPNWSHFVWRTEFITGLYESIALPALLEWLAGSPMLPMLLRCFGVRAGRRVWLDSTYITEFDLVHLGDDAEVAAQTSLQTHLFEDRVMKMSTVHVGPACTVGPRSVVLYDSMLERASQLDALSLVMKGETLPSASAWRGIPARIVHAAISSEAGDRLCAPGSL